MGVAFNEGIPSSIAAIHEDSAALLAAIMTVYLHDIHLVMARRTKRHAYYSSHTQCEPRHLKYVHRQAGLYGDICAKTISRVRSPDTLVARYTRPGFHMPNFLLTITIEIILALGYHDSTTLEATILNEYTISIIACRKIILEGNH